MQHVLLILLILLVRLLVRLLARLLVLLVLLLVTISSAVFSSMNDLWVQDLGYVSLGFCATHTTKAFCGVCLTPHAGWSGAHKLRG